jgi:hypothetical protein
MTPTLKTPLIDRVTAWLGRRIWHLGSPELEQFDLYATPDRASCAQKGSPRRE